MGHILFFSFAMFWIILGVIAFLFIRFRFFKFPKLSAVTLVTGGVKTGKSALTVFMAIRNYKRSVLAWRIKKVFCVIFRRPVPERPLLYSNIPLFKIKYVPVTRDHLLRKVRFAYKSTVILDEVSLVADSMLIKDKKVNSELLLFFKLFGHSTRGGKLFCCSHCISDLHFSLKRTTSSYFYVHDLRKLPFFSITHVREERYSDDGTVVNSYDTDTEKSLLRIMFLNSYLKKYDCYCYSVLTDSLPVPSDTTYITNPALLKSDNIVSFRSEFSDLSSGGDSNA